MDAFDADVLIYAASPQHPLGAPVRRLFARPGASPGTATVGVGSVLLLAEVLAKPRREGADDEVAALVELLAQLDLLPVDTEIAGYATVLSTRYRLHAADAVHLATAVAIGADRFITNNSRDFTGAITEVDIVTPADLQ